MRRLFHAGRSIVSLAVLGLSVQLHAQAPAPARAAADTGRRAASGLKILTLADYPKWNRINATAISSDGKWVTYTLQPNEGDATLYVKQVDGDKIYTIGVGSGGRGGRGGGGAPDGAAPAAGPSFSDDARFVAYYVNPPEARAGRGGRGGTGGRGGRGGAPQAGAATAPAPTRHFELLDLTSGEKWSVPNPASFRFANGSKWLAVRATRANPDTTHSGADLILRELATGATRNIGNVNQYDFDDLGRFFAYTVDATDRLGNGIYLLDPASGVTTALSTAAQDFDQLVWSDTLANLAVLRGEKPAGQKLRANTLLAWTDVGTPRQKAVVYDPTKDASFPAGMVVSEFSAPRFSKDASRIFVGIKEQEAEPQRSDEPQANVDVWHYRDTEAQSVQMVRLQQERRATYNSVLTIATNKLTRLADSAMSGVTATANAKWGIGRLDQPYRGEVAWGGARADYYRVNLTTGERTLIEKNLSRTMGTSPDSRWFLYLKNKHVLAFNLETAKTVSVDSIAGKSFVDDDDDHDYEKPTFGVAGWTADGHSVILNHKYDLWVVPLDGGRAVNLTNGVGDAQQIQFRLVRFGAGRGGRGGGGRGGRGGGAGDDTGVDLTKPVTLSAYGELTKKFGYWQVLPGKAPTPLIWADKNFGAPDKAANADRILFTQQTFNEFPNYWVSTTAFATPRQVTDANPQLADFAWGTKVLVDYTNSKGKHLQGTLTLPAGYQQGKKYPMLVYFYEILSNTHHNFSFPAYDDRPHLSEYASDGYLVLEPDVVYEIGHPGTSAVDCVTSAVNKVIELGYADPAHIGLQGHSWGGYQSSYIVTQTDIFAAVVTGAPPTNLISFYDELYKQTGTVQQGITEVGQVRMGNNVTPWNNHELYESQSPIFNVRNIKTPFLILQGTADGAVDWIEGLQYFNAARRNGKQVIFLSYPDEPHHLAKKENQIDFQIRMKQFFDHYLKGTPEPQWMVNGVPQVRKGESPTIMPAAPRTDH
jgi:dienelactone hydrolase